MSWTRSKVTRNILASRANMGASDNDTHQLIIKHFRMRLQLTNKETTPTDVCVTISCGVVVLVNDWRPAPSNLKLFILQVIKTLRYFFINGTQVSCAPPCLAVASWWFQGQACHAVVVLRASQSAPYSCAASRHWRHQLVPWESCRKVDLRWLQSERELDTFRFRY